MRGSLFQFFFFSYGPAGEFPGFLSAEKVEKMCKFTEKKCIYIHFNNM